MSLDLTGGGRPPRDPAPTGRSLTWVLTTGGIAGALALLLCVGLAFSFLLTGHFGTGLLMLLLGLVDILAVGWWCSVVDRRP